VEQAKPLILVTNDDGISAPGIRALIAVMSEIGTVVVVAPDSPQSATGHSITINNTLFINKISSDTDAIQEYSTSGTPVDCVKLATNEILQRRPDLCVSGINHGSNSSINVIYSGTMSAAVEAGIEGIPAIGFSLLDYGWNPDLKDISGYLAENLAVIHGSADCEALIMSWRVAKEEKLALEGKLDLDKATRTAASTKKVRSL
jgi:5'-nucleotidase